MLPAHLPATSVLIICFTFTFTLFTLFICQPYLFRPSNLHTCPTSQSPFGCLNFNHPLQPKLSYPILPMAHVNVPGKKTAAVIFSHGLGDTSSGWSFLIDEFGSRMPWVKWILPNAPVQPVSLNGGLQMPSWFDLVALEPEAPDDEKGLMASVELIGRYVQREIDNGIPPERIIVGGFSQGATIGVLTGLMSPHKLAGSVSLSGFLPLTDKLKDLRKPHSTQLPVFWGHGTDDPLVSWGQQSVDFLIKKLGMTKVEFKTYPNLGHSASPKEIEDMITWIGNQIPSLPAST
ncbi:hypothetical protein CROQUDRAFT_301324 [Cronartium quercuum f. sp. fusiforme G11]|uniref:Acyl-protein thioesterase 1 n=1 Tax=Cronartium quercuum f. sp. fusiforme G11 TaxID=708437 RepID=A0A9P6TEI8_9BASI|nr:hypothetical protein CROQUDRAFT_301324 [Cronartium quercuum f. sp. fusiforme G11]